MVKKTITAVFLIGALLTTAAAQNNWAQFRGPGSLGTPAAARGGAGQPDDQGGGQQRMAAEREEVVVDPDATGREAEDLAAALRCFLPADRVAVDDHRRRDHLRGSRADRRRRTARAAHR